MSLSLNSGIHFNLESKTENKTKETPFANRIKSTTKDAVNDHMDLIRLNQFANRKPNKKNCEHIVFNTITKNLFVEQKMCF